MPTNPLATFRYLVVKAADPVLGDPNDLYNLDEESEDY